MGVRVQASAHASCEPACSAEYVERAGITGPLREQGYRLTWIRADSEAQAIDLGWSYVEQLDPDGARARFKVKDPVCDYLVLVMKKG